MCTTNVYSYVYPDGREYKTRQPVLCSASRNGKPCSGNVMFNHPSQLMRNSSPVPAAPYYSNQFPPTPAYSPRPTTPAYRSGDDSDRSYHSSSSSRRRSSGIYINGQRVADRPSRRERILLVDNPPTARSPPQNYHFPSTAPPSPNANLSVPYGSSPRRESSSRHRPILVDERPRVEIEVRDGSSRSKRSSTSSRDSVGVTFNLAAEEEERRERHRRRQEAREEKQRKEDQIRAQKLRDRISKANEEIENRPPLRKTTTPTIKSAMATPNPTTKRSSTFTTTQSGSSSRLPRSEEYDLVDSMANMGLSASDREEKKARLRALRLEREEEDAQRQRLRERMMPRRRATVGPGSRRHCVRYDDGIYRWE